MFSNLRVPTTSQIRALESEYIKEISKFGTNWGQSLMEVAGRGVALTALGLWDANPGHVSIFCGRGNNGGDGLVAARYLHLWGVPCSVYFWGDIVVKAAAEAQSEIEDIGAIMTSPEARVNCRIFESIGGDIQFADVDDGESLRRICATSTVIIDALFGTGLSRPIEGEARKIIEAINNSLRPVLAVDLPSGLNSDTGQVMGIAVRASRTVTFGFVKPGHLNHPGAELCGDLYLVDIGLPDFGNLPEYLSHLNLKSEPRIYITTCGAVQNVLPYRPDDSHKGTFGHVLTIAGSLGMSGAGVLAATSALRVGAGLSYLATPKSLIGAVPAEEIVHKPLPETKEQSIAGAALKAVAQSLDRISSVVLGPGLSQNAETVKFVHELLDLIHKPCVVDADALNALAEKPEALPKEGNGNFVLTPHPLELSRLMGIPTAELLADRVKAVVQAAQRFNCVVVFKGAKSLIASPTGEVFINPTGNSGMATAGSGDVLSGVIAGLMAQGLSAFDAACAGVYIHGKAGDLAAAALGQAGIVAGDIRAALPLAMQNIQAGEISILEEQLSHSLLSN